MTVDCICNSWRTSVGHQQQIPLHLHTLVDPFFSEEITHRHENCREIMGKNVTHSNKSLSSYPDGAQVHRLLDDVVVVVQAQRNCINRGVKGPGIWIVSL